MCVEAYRQFYSSTQLLPGVMAELSGSSVTLALPTPAPTAPHRRPTLPASQKEAARARREQNQAAIDAEVQTWLDYTASTAAKLSVEHDKPQAHFMSLLLHMGLKMSNARKPNAHNAWLHHLANTDNEGKFSFHCFPSGRTY